MSTSKLTAEDLGRRVLALIDGIRSADDITPEKLEKAMGMTVEFNKEDRNVYGFGAALTEAWSFNLLTISQGDGRKPTELLFSFNGQTGNETDMAPVCTLDFEDYSRALVAAGFKASLQRGEHGILVSTNFTRDNVTVRVSVEPESEANPARACVSLMTIST